MPGENTKQSKPHFQLHLEGLIQWLFSEELKNSRLIGTSTGDRNRGDESVQLFCLWTVCMSQLPVFASNHNTMLWKHAPETLFVPILDYLINQFTRIDAVLGAWWLDFLGGSSPHTPSSDTSSVLHVHTPMMISPIIVRARFPQSFISELVRHSSVLNLLVSLLLKTPCTRSRTLLKRLASVDNFNVFLSMSPSMACGLVDWVLSNAKEIGLAPSLVVTLCNAVAKVDDVRVDYILSEPILCETISNSDTAYRILLKHAASGSCAARRLSRSLTETMFRRLIEDDDRSIVRKLAFEVDNTAAEIALVLGLNRFLELLSLLRSKTSLYHTIIEQLAKSTDFEQAFRMYYNKAPQESQLAFSVALCTNSKLSSLATVDLERCILTPLLDIHDKHSNILEELAKHGDRVALSKLLAVILNREAEVHREKLWSRFVFLSATVTDHMPWISLDLVDLAMKCHLFNSRTVAKCTALLTREIPKALVKERIDLIFKYQAQSKLIPLSKIDHESILALVNEARPNEQTANIAVTKNTNHNTKRQASEDPQVAPKYQKTSEESLTGLFTIKELHDDSPLRARRILENIRDSRVRLSTEEVSELREEFHLLFDKVLESRIHEKL